MQRGRRQPCAGCGRSVYGRVLCRSCTRTVNRGAGATAAGIRSATDSDFALRVTEEPPHRLSQTARFCAWVRRGRVLVLALMACASTGRDAVPSASDYDDFNLHWGRFYRAYLGCPPHATDVSQCDPKAGSIDYAEFNAAAKFARRLFQ